MIKKYEIVCCCEQKIEIVVETGKCCLVKVECGACGNEIDISKKHVKATVIRSVRVDEIFEKPQDAQMDIPFNRNVDADPVYKDDKKEWLDKSKPIEIEYKPTPEAPVNELPSDDTVVEGNIVSIKKGRKKKESEEKPEEIKESIPE